MYHVRYVGLLFKKNSVQFNHTVCWTILHKHFLNLQISYLTEYAYSTKLCLEFSSADTVYLEIKSIGCKCSP